jgi:hypothetical protein
MALGNRIFVDWIDGWHEEGEGIGVNVNWIHTKFMLIDPLGTKPITLTGSANWSVPSVTDNDENVWSSAATSASPTSTSASSCGCSLTIDSASRSSGTSRRSPVHRPPLA